MKRRQVLLAHDLKNGKKGPILFRLVNPGTICNCRAYSGIIKEESCMFGSLPIGGAGR